MARSHTKSGPGRTHGQCQLIADPTNGKHLGVRTSVQRRAPANFGGNWKGVQYLSYREHDTQVRARLVNNEFTPSPATRVDGSIDPYSA